MHDLTNFELGDMVQCGAALRGLGASAASMEDAGARVVRYLYDELTDEHGARALALVRFYKTHAFGHLPAPLKASRKPSWAASRRRPT